MYYSWSGCGCGRDVVWLACRALTPPAPAWTVVGMDFVAPHLERINHFAASFGAAVASRVRTTRAKILDDASVRVCDAGPDNGDAAAGALAPFDFSQVCYDLVVCVRFLERNFLPTLRRMVKPGGFILYQTFVGGLPDKPLSHPTNPKVVLQPGELSTVFGPTHGFRALVDRVELLPDGRPVHCVVARRDG